MKFFKCTILVFLLFLSASASADTDACPSSELLSGKLITDFCWDCPFPFVIMGSTQPGNSPKPNLSSDSIFCTCKDQNGVPEPGFMTGYWNPSFAIDMTRAPDCAPSLGGVRLPFVAKGRGGNLFESQAGVGEQGHDTDEQFMYYTYYALPVMRMIGMATSVGMCDNGMLPDFDPMYFSALDPSYNSEPLAFMLFPEAALYSRPDAVLSCGADLVHATTFGEPLETLNWCAWGSLYNISGAVAENETWQIVTNKTAVRSIAAQHRRGQARLTMGDAASCGGVLYPTLPKTQYRLNYFYPIAEADTNHAISEHEMLWGSGKFYPGRGEDATMVVWKWNDCCEVF